MRKFPPVMLALLNGCLMATPALSGGLYSCPYDKNVVYRTDFHFESDTGHVMPGSFVYYYPQTQLPNSSSSFARAENHGVAMAVVQVCVPKGEQPPRFIHARYVLKGPFDGNQYRIQQRQGRMYHEAGWSTQQEPVILTHR